MGERCGSALVRVVHAVSLLARDGRIPWPLRAAAAFASCRSRARSTTLPLLRRGTFRLFYRDRIRAAWTRSPPDPAE